jgi:hypothetical protein
MRTATICTGIRNAYYLTSHRCCLILLLFCVPTQLFCQMTARAIGMGWAYTALARGSHAPAWNPANLGLPDNPKFSMTFISIGAGTWNNSFTKGMYDRYFIDGPKDQDGDIVWNQQDIQDILNHIPDGGLNADVSASMRAFSFSSGRFALSAGAVVGSFFKLDKSVFELALQGNEIGETYSLQNADGRGLGIGLVSLSLGHPVQASFADYFSVGGSFNFLYGIAYGKVDRADFSLSTLDYGFDLNGEYEATYALGSLGWGIDLGVAAQLKEKWTLSLGIENFIGSIPWSKEVTKQIGYIRGDSLTVLNIEEDDEEDVLQDSTWDYETTKFSKKLPSVLRCGLAYEEGPVVMTADYAQGFEQSAFASTTPRFAVGTEWNRLEWLPLRLGVVVGGRIGFGTSLGFGIRSGGFVLDFGLLNRGFIAPKNSKGLIMALEIGMELRKIKSDVVRVNDF